MLFKTYYNVLNDNYTLIKSNKNATNFFAYSLLKICTFVIYYNLIIRLRTLFMNSISYVRFICFATLVLYITIIAGVFTGIYFGRSLKQKEQRITIRDFYRRTIIVRNNR